MAFKAPNNYLDFYNEMVRKSEKLIEPSEKLKESIIFQIIQHLKK